MVRQQFLFLHYRWWNCCVTTFRYNRCVGCLSGQNGTDDIATTFEKCVSTEHLWFLVLHFGKSMGNATVSTQYHGIGSLYEDKCYWLYHYNLLKISVIGVSMILGPAFWIIWGLWNGNDSQSTYQLPSWAKMLLKILCLPPTIECPWSVNSFCGGSVSYTAMKCIALLLNWVLRDQSFQYVLVYNFRNMHAMSHRSDFCCL